MLAFFPFQKSIVLSISLATFTKKSWKISATTFSFVTIWTFSFKTIEVWPLVNFFDKYGLIFFQKSADLQPSTPFYKIVIQ